MQATDPVTVLSGRYALDVRLGRSATGMVWLATDTLLRRRVIVKLIHPRLADDPVFSEALAAEVRRVAALTDPRLARLLDSGEDQSVSFLVREHLEGRSLRTRLEEDGPLPHLEAVPLVVAVLRALAAAHGAGELHLALGPDDVIVSEDGEIRVTGLGIGAAVVAARAAQATEFLGPDLAPEAALGGPVDVRTDVYAVGALAFQILTGEPPRGRTSVRELRPTVPRKVDRTVARALDPDPDRRFPDVSAFERELAPDGEPDDLAVPPGGERAGGGLLSWVGIPLLIAGVAAAAIALGLWFGTLEVGGPLGIRPAEETTGPAEVTFRAERPVSAFAIDPFGDDSEFSMNALRAIDGDPATLWRSEDYFDGELGKPGIGLVLDLGRSRRIVGLRLWTPHPGYAFQIAAGDDPDALLELVGEPLVADSLTRAAFDGRGRYVLIWITSVVPAGDGNRAEVAEARVVVPAIEPSDA